MSDSGGPGGPALSAAAIRWLTGERSEGQFGAWNGGWPKTRGSPRCRRLGFVCTLPGEFRLTAFLSRCCSSRRMACLPVTVLQFPPSGHEASPRLGNGPVRPARPRAPREVTARAGIQALLALLAPGTENAADHRGHGPEGAAFIFGEGTTSYCLLAVLLRPCWSPFAVLWSLFPFRSPPPPSRDIPDAHNADTSGCVVPRIANISDAGITQRRMQSWQITSRQFPRDFTR